MGKNVATTRASFTGHRHEVRCLDFARDGKTLASGGKDNVVYLGDVTGVKTLPAEEVNPAACRNDLASEDGRGEIAATTEVTVSRSLHFLFSSRYR